MLRHEKDMIPHFITFHVTSSPEHGPAHPNTNLSIAAYAESINLLFRSARLHHPSAQLTIITNTGTDLSDVQVAHRRLDVDVDPTCIMLERARAQAKLAATLKHDEVAFFIDSDMLINGSLSDLIAMDFDVAVTVRGFKVMPINGGLIVAKGRSARSTAAFFDAFLSLYERKYLENKQWFGDQYALQDLLSVDYTKADEVRLLETEFSRVLLLPCEIYNFSPDPRQPIERSLPDKRILHFKGPRKALMASYWRDYIDPNGQFVRNVSEAASGFNCASQSSSSCSQRATLATNLIVSEKLSISRSITIADIGCGDKKLENLLKTSNMDFYYQGYDLLPQASDVKKIDVSALDWKISADFVVLLGVIEYLESPERVLR